MNKIKLVLALLSIGSPVFIYSMTPADEQLLDAIYEGDIQQAIAALDAGANCNTIDTTAGRNYNCTALYSACEISSKDMVELLLEKHAHASAQDDEGDTPLHIYAHRVDTEDQAIIDLLLAAGADINALNNKSQTVLHIACEKGKARMVKFLLEKGANPSIKDSYGDTPLHYATGYEADPHKAFNVINLLLATGVDINAQNNAGHTPFFNAIDCYIRKWYCDKDLDGVVVSCIKILRLLIENGARKDLKYSNPDIFTYGGWKYPIQYTALEIAIEYDYDGQNLIALLNEIPSLKNLTARAIKNALRQKQVTLEYVKSSIPEDLHAIVEPHNSNFN